MNIKCPPMNTRYWNSEKMEYVIFVIVSVIFENLVPVVLRVKIFNTPKTPIMILSIQYIIRISAAFHLKKNIPKSTNALEIIMGVIDVFFFSISFIFINYILLVWS